jgi:hypothetical protein
VNLESTLKAKLVTECKKLGAYARRHEDRYALGLLDLAIKFPGHPHLLAEGKIVEWQSFGPTPRQYEEGKQYTAAGGLCCLIGWTKFDKKMYVAAWGKSAKKETSFHSEIGNQAEQLLEWLATR